MTSRSRHLPPSLYRAALELLDAALEPIAEVADTSSAGRVELLPRGSDIQPVNLTFAPWSDQDGTPSARRSASRTIWVTQRAPASVREHLRHRDWSFIDIGTGTVRLRLPGLLIDRTGLRPRRVSPETIQERSPYSDRGSLVTRVLLANPERSWPLQEIAERATISKATASRVINSLENDRLVHTQRLGRSLQVAVPSPWPLFMRWAAGYRWTDNAALPVAAPVGDPGKFLRRLAPLLGERAGDVDWALTLQAGASLVAPHATWETIHLYVNRDTPADLQRLASALDWPPSPQGRVVLMAPRYRHAAWWGLQYRHDLPVVHPVQLMLDLWHYPVRGREQAEHLARSLGWPAVSG